MKDADMRAVRSLLDQLKIIRRLVDSEDRAMGVWYLHEGEAPKRRHGVLRPHISPKQHGFLMHLEGGRLQPCPQARVAMIRGFLDRSEERRVGKEVVRRGRS